MVEPRTLRGFRDYLPDVMIPRQKMLAKVEATFQRFGFLPLMTPALERLEVLQGKYGEEGEKLLYSFETRGERAVALRYDLTVPLARVIAQYGELPMPFRRYQIAPVWRAERPQRGRFREFLQCDGDIVGSADMAADGEILGLACALLDDLGVENRAIRINNRKVLSGLMHRIGIVDPEREKGVLRTIDKLPKIGPDETRRLLEAENGLSAEQAARVFEFLSIDGSSGQVLERLDAFFAETAAAGADPGREGARELRELFDIVEALGIGGSVSIDLSIARGLDYYTGTIYEAFLTDLPGYGAVMGGGRYDNLIGVFKGADVPAVGISLGTDRLLQGLIELDVLETPRSVVDVLVTVFDASLAPRSARVAQTLRRAGIGCELYPAAAKIGKQFKHAERAGMRWVVVVGPDEAAQGRASVKDLRSGAQETVAETELAGHLKSRAGPG